MSDNSNSVYINSLDKFHKEIKKAILENNTKVLNLVTLDYVRNVVKVDYLNKNETLLNTFRDIVL